MNYYPVDSSNKVMAVSKAQLIYRTEDSATTSDLNSSTFFRQPELTPREPRYRPRSVQTGIQSDKLYASCCIWWDKKCEYSATWTKRQSITPSSSGWRWSIRRHQSLGGPLGKSKNLENIPVGSHTHENLPKVFPFCNVTGKALGYERRDPQGVVSDGHSS